MYIELEVTILGNNHSLPVHLCSIAYWRIEAGGGGGGKGGEGRRLGTGRGESAAEEERGGGRGRLTSKQYTYCDTSVNIVKIIHFVTRY